MIVLLSQKHFRPSPKLTVYILDGSFEIVNGLCDFLPDFVKNWLYKAGQMR